MKVRLYSPWLSDALSALSSRDNGSSLAKRKDKGPPTGYDFEHFFANHFMDTSLMVFWYGTGHDKAKDFALAKGRNTLEMILGDTWHYYQTIKPDGKWDNWTDADTHFWGPISKAAGRASTGEVYVFSSEDKNIDRQVDDTLRVNCPTCWYLGEKPALIERLGEGKVAQITKFLQSDSNKIVGVIKEMGD